MFFIDPSIWHCTLILITDLACLTDYKTKQYLQIFIIVRVNHDSYLGGTETHFPPEMYNLVKSFCILFPSSPKCRWYVCLHKSGTTSHVTGKHIAPAYQSYMSSSLAYPEIRDRYVANQAEHRKENIGVTMSLFSAFQYKRSTYACLVLSLLSC